MKNAERYEHSLKAALAAYDNEMGQLSDLNLGGDMCPFEVWAEREEDYTAKAVAAEKRTLEEMKMAEEAEMEAISNGMEELAKFYKDAGWAEADALLDKIMEVAPEYEVYENMASACNVFHSGAWSVMCEDFKGVWDLYQYVKREGCGYPSVPCRSPSEFIAYMKSGLPEAIAKFIEDAKALIPRLEAEKKGQAAK